MLTASKLEKIIELEQNLRAEYQDKLDALTAEAERYRAALADQQEQLQTTIDQQLESIKQLTASAVANEKVEQQNRELSNRSQNLQDEVTTLKQRIKNLQKDLAEERQQVKTLAQFDPARMKKNLDANKKKLAEKTKANELLEKSLKEARGANAEQNQKLKEVRNELAQLKASLGTEDEAA
ncbi:hypothetical protein BST95_01370 [Halioglobus japonicus]|uniref:Uncharacterized protein n=1 Tax=Halioglobus japonicus TaxID=930805 RepID=A0AAP8MBY3_9GAMM|nr:hypothetical protein [Halioglobus japonicus]AQA17063.1 hypothetical protein BST95_01370 [Halioglobus japonicus]PLW84970.1 hypothetical protein C0029_15630 [Halioglobus japonicus]GHD18793.1 hypothetical protein GCM10007052_26520 [Halioglobus japonicus]